MGLKMGAVVVSGPKLLPALLALEGLFTGMDLRVSFKIGDLSERLIAALVGTLVRLVACVDANVLLERRVLSERLSTSFVGTLFQARVATRGDLVVIVEWSVFNIRVYALLRSLLDSCANV